MNVPASLHSALDTRPAPGLANHQHVTGNRLNTFPPTAGCVRWYCAWTHQQRERIAARSIEAAGFNAYLPLFLHRRLYSRSEIVPLFPRYVMLQFAADRDPWGCISTLRGVCGLIRHAADRPTPLPDAAIAELLARTSPRGIVDDPAEAPQTLPHAVKPVWQDMSTMDAAARSRLLIRQFGERAAKRHMENAA